MLVSTLRFTIAQGWLSRKQLFLGRADRRIQRIPCGEVAGFARDSLA